MSGLVCPSPMMLDQSFPRTDLELAVVSVALGKLQQCLEDRQVLLLVTATLEEFVLAFDWQRECSSELRDIYYYLAHVLIGTGDHFVLLEMLDSSGGSPHPLPIGAELTILTAKWADEMGLIRDSHAACSVDGESFIGICCAYAFAGMEKGAYLATDDDKVLPLIGPTDLAELTDAFEWQIDSDVANRPVSFELAYKNVAVIGAIAVDHPSGGSHFKVRFAGARSWPLDRNVSPIPARFLDQLTDITGYPRMVVRSALLDGRLPARRLRLEKSGKCLVRHCPDR